MTFDTIITIDWSGGNQRPTTPSTDAIWASVWHYGTQKPPMYFRNRQLVEFWLRATLDEELKFGRRVFVGFDFAFGFPEGFTAAVTGHDDPLAIWGWLEAHIMDSPQANNRFEVAGLINARFDGIGPFWGNASATDIDALPRKGRDRTCRAFAERRQVETRIKGAFPVWQLAGAGAVGSQTLMGLPVLERLRRRFAGKISVWPFELLETPVAFVEIWPSLYANEVTANAALHPIKDAVQVHTLTQIIAAMDGPALGRTLDVPPNSEGWIFGVPA